jgi:hypothetical protein
LARHRPNSGSTVFRQDFVRTIFATLHTNVQTKDASLTSECSYLTKSARSGRLHNPMDLASNDVARCKWVAPPNLFVQTLRHSQYIGRKNLRSVRHVCDSARRASVRSLYTSLSSSLPTTKSTRSGTLGETETISSKSSGGRVTKRDVWRRSTPFQTV